MGDDIWEELRANADPKKLREKAGRYDARANTAERDGDFFDAVRWKRSAIELRRRARQIEFGDQQ